MCAPSAENAVVPTAPSATVLCVRRAAATWLIFRDRQPCFLLFLHCIMLLRYDTKEANLTNFLISAVLDKEKNLVVTQQCNQNQGENNSTEIKISVPQAMTTEFQFFLEFACPQNKRYVSPQLQLVEATDGYCCYLCSVPSCVLQEEGFVTFQLVARKMQDNAVIYKSNKSSKTAFFVHQSVNAANQTFEVEDFFANFNGALANETYLREKGDRQLQLSVENVLSIQTAHANTKDNPHAVSKDQVGLSRADNTADAEKRVAYATCASCDENGNVISTTYAKQSQLPTSLPASGGNADTLQGKNAADFATAAQGAKADTAYQKPQNGILLQHLEQSVQDSIAKANSAVQSLSGFATETFVNEKVASIINSAPQTLDTLNELAAALDNDPNFATTVANQIGQKADLIAMNQALETKVDAEQGKTLSQNDFTDQLLAKLQGVDEGANRTVIANVLGESQTAAISQKAVADALATKANKTDLQDKADRDDLQSLATTNYVDEQLAQKASLAADNSFEGKNTFSHLCVQDVYYGQEEESLITKLDGKADKSQLAGFATETFVSDKVAAIVSSAPETLNTLNELATALGNDPNFATTIANQIGQKADASALQNYAKVDDDTQSVTAKQLTVQKIYHGQDDRELIAEVSALQNDKADKSQLSSYATKTQLSSYAKLDDNTQTIKAAVFDAENAIKTVASVADTYYCGDTNSPLVVQTTGQSTVQVMSQKAVTDLIGDVNSLLDAINGEVI